MVKKLIPILLLLIATGLYYFQTQVAGKPKKAKVEATPPPPLVSAVMETQIQTFLGKAQLRSTILGPPDIAIIDGKEVVEGGVLHAGPGVELKVTDIADGFVMLAFKDRSYRLDKALPPPPPSPRR